MTDLARIARYWPYGYADARARFQAFVAAGGGTLSAETLDVGRGGEGEPLGIDVAVFGNAEAEKALVSVSGTHGLEGAAGTAAQLQLIDAMEQKALGNDVKLVLIHALNPWGYSHLSRGNEDNVDLSRNFVDFAKPPVNAAYSYFHDAWSVRAWGDAAPDLIAKRFAEATRDHGPQFAIDGVVAGQYTHADGANYGGQSRAASNRALGAICGRHLSGVRCVGYVEWHTGVGAWQELFHITVHPPGSRERALCEAWWGDRFTRTGDGYAGTAPRWTGLVIDGMRAFLPDAEIVGAALEFGTYAPPRMAAAMQIDLWRRFGIRTGDTVRDAELRARMVESFVPSEPAWRETALAGAAEAHLCALRGVAAW